MIPFCWSLLGPRWWMLAMVVYPANFLVGFDASAWRWSLPIWLGGHPLFSGLRIDPADILAAAGDANRWRSAAGFSVLRLLLIPLLAWFATRLIAPEWAAGVLLVALMPAGLSAIAFTDILKGDRMLALLAVVVSCFFAPFTIPAILQWLDPSAGRLDVDLVLSRVGWLTAMLGIPLAAAQVLRFLVPRIIASHETAWGRLAVAFSIVNGSLSILTTHPAWSPHGLAGLLTPLLLSTIPVLIAVGIGAAARVSLPRPSADALICGGVYLNNGLGVTFAIAAFPDRGAMILPSILIILPMVVGMVVLSEALPANRHDSTTKP